MTRPRRHLNRAASAGLIAVLAILTGFSLWSAFIGEQAGSQVRASTHLVAAYARAEQALAVEDSAHYEYWAESMPVSWQEFLAASRAFRMALRDVLRYSSGTADGGRENLADVRRLARQQVEYARAGRQFFAANGKDASTIRYRLEAGTIDPLHALMARETAQALSRERAETFATVDGLQGHELVARNGALIIFPLGLILLGLFWVVQVRGLRDEAARRAEMTQLERMALTDSITGLGNHRAFQEDLEREMVRSWRHAHPLSLALVDIDDFKIVNDENGHAHGDRVLAELAGLLQGVRASDRAFRLGGDEFALILPDTDQEQAQAMVERLRSEAQRSLLGATVSVGIAHLGPTTEDLESFREQADAALYEAKRRGQNCLVTFDEVRNDIRILSTPKIQAVRALLAERGISIVFQPIWNIETSSIMAYEALMRPNPSYGLAGPADVFDIAERIGKAHDLDTVCREAILAQAGDLPPHALLFINVSPQTLDHGSLGGTTLVDAVEAAGLHPGRVVLEVTERAVPRLQTVIREAQRLREAGFRIALDDVGCGNAGLEMLQQLQVDFVKVDRSIVSAAVHDRSACAVLSAVIAFTHHAGSCVIAEGIENDEMLEMVRMAASSPGEGKGAILGAQGYLLGRPGALPSPQRRALAG